ncbi:MAG TPA: twitching motility protein PilT [Cyanobacteria bacterium UBA11149]|nr:twitching motility protein PilT [Cyanobacteria bacterium UBA11367]HBE57433.1 twitching motility protein PilT [Cyanobacteria bacterium UBA11366]HBK62835.1 twitching motility protein PilT [Cyanobacteria bacterium UBA11166]HBR73088.1 twitching motility protein PilT [Cyanobacteria bacterium UBA11159]HBS72674.1 twitching motility protein PilT [Cyanobacteria bacterium UBA11153]HBW88735.1 twitching motility protein PilT [Cyanobacteria bacterium UBA11149]HCA95171.1 twitching motility protein PilT 
MASAEFQFMGELNHFLPSSRREISFTHFFKGRASIKDTIESLGVPHPEVDAILVNGEAVDFSYIVQDCDRIIVYPVSVASQIKPPIRLALIDLSEYRFILDIHLGKLANALRLLGFNSLYRNDYDDIELARVSADEDRILLTRDKGLLMRSIVRYGYYVRATNPEEQIIEVMQRFNLFNVVSPFRRCIRCNGLLESVSKEVIIDELPENTKLNVDKFHRCQDCEQIYWKGSHFERMQQFIDGVLASQA